MSDDLQMAHRIAELVKESGGRAYFVGGYVRDSVMNQESKDIDIEVHGVEFEELKEILGSLGKVQTMGASFEILNLKHYGLDIALPEEIHGGAMSAALRRDFTMNALMMDVLTGEILDFFGGVDDIHAKRIRAVSSRSFLLDPLRVFRAARFCATLGFDVDDEAAKFAECVDVGSLASERVMNELALTLLKSQEPSRFFAALAKMHQADNWFAEFAFSVPDVLDSAAVVRESARDKLYFMMSALCCELDDISCDTFLQRLTREVNLRNYVFNMKDLLAKMRIAGTEFDYMKIFDDSVCPDDLLLLHGLIDDNDNASCMLGLYRSRMSEPYLTGRDLIELGFEPGVMLGRALSYAHELRLLGFTKGQITSQLKLVACKSLD